MTLDTFVVNFAERHILNASTDSFPTGHNGVHNDEHTPARLLGHGIMILSKCYYITHEQKYLKKVRELADFLLTFRFGFAFHHILTKKKDPSNGLIGQAWTIEALAEASTVLNDDRYRNVALDLYFQHKFDSEDGLWYILDVSGRHYPKDATFNHQLWFAACASCLNEQKIDKDICIFLDKIDMNLTQFNNGLIHHSVIHLHKNFKHRLGGILKHLLNGSFFYRFLRKPKISSEDFYSMCVGYHAFNIYAFAILKNNFPDRSLWRSKGFSNVLSYLNSSDFLEQIYKSGYGFPYNPPGFEVLFSNQVFNFVDDTLISRLIKSQFDLHFDLNRFSFSRNNSDSDTLNFRIYELCRVDTNTLNNIKIRI
jgi:hypothetical protein